MIPPFPPVVMPAGCPSASVVIPTRNGAHLLAECLRALADQTYADFETIVVDDASTDGTQQVMSNYPHIVVVRLPGKRGHGFVAAANAGLAHARGDIIVLLNNDAVPDPHWLRALIGALERHSWAGMAASRLVLYDRPGVFHSTGDYYGLDGMPGSRGVWQADMGQYDLEEEVFGPCAAAAAYRRSVLADLAHCGGTQPPGYVFDPQLWMYCEDVDLNLRARLRGHRTIYVPTARVLHRLSATGGGPLASFYVGRNLIYLIAKDLPASIIGHNALRMVNVQLSLALQALRHIREPAARARLRGMLVGLLTWPRVLPSRHRVLRSATLNMRQFEAMMARFWRQAIH